MVYGKLLKHTARHSLQHASICYEVRRWPTTTVRATVPCRERTATWCCSLAPLVPQTVLGQSRATCAWQFSLGDIRCTNKMHQLIWRPSCNAGKEDRRDLHWRQPWTQTLWPSGQRRKPEITPLGVPQTSFHGRVVLLLVRQNRRHILSGRSGFFPCHKGIKGVFQNLLQAFRVYTLRGFISHQRG